MKITMRKHKKMQTLCFISLVKQTWRYNLMKRRMNMKYFAIGDIHGSHNELMMMLEKHWDSKEEKLILLGDLVDRGPKSKEVIETAMSLKEQNLAIVLGGNHEQLFLDWLDEPDDEGFYYDMGGRETIHSFYDSNITFHKSAEWIASDMKIRFQRHIDFLKNLQDYYETKHYIFVHAGVNLAYADWKNSSQNEFRWTRRPFIYGKNETGKTFVFGHTLTNTLNTNKSNDVWFSPCGSKIGVDGGCASGGLLLGLKIDNTDIKVYSIEPLY